MAKRGGAAIFDPLNRASEYLQNMSDATNSAPLIASRTQSEQFASTGLIVSGFTLPPFKVKSEMPGALIETQWWGSELSQPPYAAARQAKSDDQGREGGARQGGAKHSPEGRTCNGGLVSLDVIAKVFEPSQL
jgi:hypothetical protein